MKNYYLIGFLMLLLAACGSMDQYQSLATPGKNSEGVTVSSAPYATAMSAATSTPDAVQTAMMVIAIDAATSTKEAANTSLAYTATSIKATEEINAFWMNVTVDSFTQQAMQTQAINTKNAATSQSDSATKQPVTQTALASTQTIERDRLNSKRAATWIWNVGGSISGLAIMILLVVGLYYGVQYLQGRGTADLSIKSHIKPDEKGRFPLLPESLLNGQKLVNPNLGYSPVLDPTAAERLTNEQMLENTQSARKLEMVRSVVESPALNKLALGLMKRSSGNDGHKPTNGGVTITKPDLPLLPVADPSLHIPSWKLLNKWDGNLLPYGVNENSELMLVDPAERPHLLVIGTTGAGKTRSAIRTIVSGALTTGWNVVVLGKNVDYLPFEDHANMKIVAVDVRKDPRKYIDVLRTLTAQMDVRDQILSAARVSTWDRYGAAQTMVILDDFTGAMMRMQKKDAVEVLSEAKQIAMDGRKFGLNLLIGLQRATWTSIDTDLRSQMGRIVYRVESASDSRVALDEDGAERLPKGHFLTKLTDDASIQRGVGFFLEDREVEAFLSSRPVQENEPLDWIEGEVKDVTHAPVTAVTPVESVPAAVTITSAPIVDEDGYAMSADMADARKKADEIIQIQDLYSGYLSRKEKPSLRAIEMTVYGKTGGSYTASVKKAVCQIEQCEMEELTSIIAQHVADWSREQAAAQATTTTDFMPGMGVFEANHG